jgi:hypothetical protein
MAPPNPKEPEDRRAELAAKLDPDRKSVRTQDTLGAAYYRVGEFQKALDLFGPQVEPAEKRSEKGLVPAYAEDERNRALLREAEALLGDKETKE